MRAGKGGRECQKGSSSARWPQAQCCGLYAVLVAALLGYHTKAVAQAPAAEQPAAQPRAAAPKVDAPSVQTDRLTILQQERSRTLDLVEKLKSGADPLALQRALGDLQALDREIASVSRESPYPIKTQKAAGNTAARQSAVAQATTPSQPNDIVYEGWDVFRNFGKKAN